MASNTTPRKPANGDRQRIDRDHAQHRPPRGGDGSMATVRSDRGMFTFGAAVVTAGLIAGLFFGYALTVVPALAGTDDRTFIEVLNLINDAVYNPVFFVVLLGAPALIAVTAVQQRRGENPGAARWTWAALALYVAGVMVTSAVNVPLTIELVAAGDPSNITDPAAVRERFEDPFNAWNIVRTILHTAAVACLVMPARFGRNVTVTAAQNAPTRRYQ